MALSKDILGQDLFTVRQQFSNQTRDELLNTYGSDDAIRLAACKAEAQAIINHFTAAGVVNVNVVTAGTATAQSGTGIGHIS